MKASGHPDFDAFYARYPKKIDPDPALRAYRKQIRAGATHEAIMAALEADIPRLIIREERGVPGPGPWLNKGNWKLVGKGGLFDPPAPNTVGPDDPYGLKAWFDRQPDRKINAKGHWEIGGYHVDEVMPEVAARARLPDNWRGNLDALGDWLRADITSKQIYAGVQQWAERTGYPPVATLHFFDSAVRNAAQPKWRLA